MDAASNKGTPEAAAMFAAWEEAESGGKSLASVQRAYDQAFSQVKKVLAQHEANPDQVDTPVSSDGATSSAEDMEE